MDYRPLLLLLLCLPALTQANTMNERLAVLERDIEALRVELDIPALALVLVDREQVLLSKTYGVIDRDSRGSFGPDHYFRIGSITKTFTALAALRLVQEGRLALDDRVNDIDPVLDIDNPWRKSDPVTIEQLLEHTAGLNDLTAREFEYNEPLTLEQAFSLSPGSRQVRWPPGRHHSYSNNSPGLLAHVIGKITAMRFEDYMDRAVLRPLGMDSATLFPEPRVMQHLVTGYDSDGKTAIPYWHMTYRAFGAMNLKPADMAPFLQLFLNRGMHGNRVFLDSALIERMETPRTTLAARSGLKFGYGLNLYTSLHDGHVFYGHGGDADGYLSRFGYQKEAGLAYYLGINVFRNADLTRIRKRVQDFIVAGLPEPEANTADVPTTVLKTYSGEYESVSWRFPNTPAAEVTRQRLVIVLRDAQLMLRKDGQSDRLLLPVTRQHFRFEDEPVATLAFIEHEGELYLQTNDGNYRKINKGSNKGSVTTEKHSH